MRFAQSSRWLMCLLLASSIGTLSHATEYTLATAIAYAQANDPWLTGSDFREQHYRSLGISAGSLPDPTVNIAFANLPTDTFAFNQEPMTQLRFGVSQVFPRGNSRALQKEQLEKMGQIEPYARADRKASVAVTVSHLWLDAYRYQTTINLIESDRGLFEQLVDVAQTSYSSAFGQTRQQDVVRAQLELTQLEDRLTQLLLQRDIQIARLGEWLSNSAISPASIARALPVIPLRQSNLIGTTPSSTRARALTTLLSDHPKVKSIEQKISAMDAGIELAEQRYKPQWGLNASYAYRDQAPNGTDRADFFTIGVSLDVPIFTTNRQDKQVEAAIAQAAAVGTEKTLALRQLKAEFDATDADYRRLLERQQLFDSRLLKEVSQQAEASLNAYINDDSDFSEVARAHIAELNQRIAALNIDVDIQKAIAKINYFLVADTETAETIYE